MFLIHFGHNLKWRITSTITSIVHVSMCPCVRGGVSTISIIYLGDRLLILPLTSCMWVCILIVVRAQGEESKSSHQSVSVMAFFKFTSQRVQPMVWQGLKGHKGQWQLCFIQCSKIQHSLNVSGRTHTDRLTISFSSPGAVKLDVTFSTALNAASNDSFSVTSA